METYIKLSDDVFTNLIDDGWFIYTNEYTYIQKVKQLLICLKVL